MKNFHHIFFFSLILVSVLASNTGRADWATLPQDWYKLPETTGTPLNQAENKKSFDDKGAEKAAIIDKSLGTIMSANEDLLSHLNPEKSVQKGRWGLGGFESNITISSSGLLGILTLKGESTTKLVWRPKTAKISSDEESEADVDADADEDDTIPIVINGSMTAKDLEEQLEPSIKAAVATKKVKNVARLRSNLKKVVSEFAGLTAALHYQPDEYTWWINRLRLDIAADASGKVLPFANVGSDIQFRLEFNRLQEEAPAPSTKAFEKQMNSPLGRFITTMSRDLEVISNNHSEKSGFEVDSFRVGIGIGVEGKIFVAKVGAKVVGGLYFNKGKLKPVTAASGSTAKNFLAENDDYLLGDKEIAEHVKYAQVNGVPFERELMEGDANNKNAMTRVIYRVSRAKFRNGLMRAIRMANFFTNAAGRRPGKSWQIQEVQTSFDISLGGTFVLTAVNGIATTEIFFNRK